MQIDKVRVQNFKSIQDSGWVSLEDDLTALVGENEAGKSNFLEALSYIGKEGEVPRESLCRESVDDWATVDKSKISFLSIRGDFPHLKEKSMTETFKKENEIKIKVFMDLSHTMDINQKSVRADRRSANIKQELAEETIKIDNLNIQEETIEVVERIDGGKYGKRTKTHLRDIFNSIFNENKNEYIDTIVDSKLLSDLRIEYKNIRRLGDMPFKFTKFEKSLLSCSIYNTFGLVENSSPKMLNRSTDPYSELSDFMKLKGNTEDNISRHRRDNRIKKASNTLLEGFERYWGQVNIDFRVEVKNEKIFIKILEEISGYETLTYPEERSEGFRWFLSFYLQLMSLDGSGGVDDDVILLDDPGTYLHPKGQKDLREALQKLAEDTQIVYSTHSPYMLDPDETREIRLVQRNDDVDDPDESERTPGTTVHTDLSQADAPGYDTLAPVRAALGAEYADSLFASTANLLVEGYTDETYLKRLSQVFADAADETDGDALDGDTAAGLPDECSVLQMSGAGNTTALVRLLEAEGYDYYVLLDDDRAGDVTREDLDEIGTADEQFGYVTDFLPDGFENAEIEDLFDDERLVELFTANHDAVDREAFADAFDGTEKFTRRACSAVNKVQGRNGADADFQHGDVAKDAMAQDLDRRFAHGDWTVDDLAPETREAFRELFTDVRSAVE